MTALLFLDFESTGLTAHNLTVLEAAWCVTDMDGTERSPIRSRFTALSTSEEPPVVPDKTTMGSHRWLNESAGNSYALTMAQESGLFTDWLACPRNQIIREAAELERLLLDDLAAVVDPGEPNPNYSGYNIRLAGEQPGPWLREPERVHLAGAGVAQFDQPTLRILCPKVSQGSGRVAATHYRTVDTSVAQTVLLGGAEDEKLIEWARAAGSPVDIDIALGFPPHYAYGNRDVISWLAKPKMHRAAPDVARAIVIHRALRRFALPLRRKLGLETAESE